MGLSATGPGRTALCVLVTCALVTACKKPTPPDPGPDLQVVSEALRLRADAPFPRTSPFFDGTTIRLTAARGEIVGFQVLHRLQGATLQLHVSVPGVTVRSYAVDKAVAKRASTSGLYGAGQGAGAYPDRLTPDDAPRSAPAYFELAVARDAAPGHYQGELALPARTIPVELEIASVTLPEPAPRVWAYYDPRELAWAHLGSGTHDAPSDQERACIATFRDFGVMLSPDLPLSAWPARKDLLAGFPFVPVKLTTDPAAAGDEVRGWIAATKDSGHLPFAIPIDEPRKPDARAKVKALSAAVRAAGGGLSTFLYAVTAPPHPELGDAIDLYITLRAKRGDTFARWTYNGKPPGAGAMLLDATPPGPRTWGWIAARYNIGVWYVWDALYWHDRHNRHGAPLPGRAMDPTTDAITFDDGEDHGNLDGMLAYPGDDRLPCQPSLRLAAIRRGQQDRALIELAAQCNAGETDKLVAQLVPRALGDAPNRGAPAWPSDDTAWDTARRALIDVAASCTQ